MWGKVFKNGASQICGRQPLKNYTWSIFEYFVSYGLSKGRSKKLNNSYSDI